MAHPLLLHDTDDPLPNIEQALYPNFRHPLSIDDVLVYKGHIRKAPPRGSESEDFGQTLIFTNDRRVVQRERERVYVHYKSDNDDLLLIDSGAKAGGGDGGRGGGGREEQRPGTSVYATRGGL